MTYRTPTTTTVQLPARSLQAGMRVLVTPPRPGRVTRCVTDVTDRLGYRVVTCDDRSTTEYRADSGVRVAVLVDGDSLLRQVGADDYVCAVCGSPDWEDDSWGSHGGTVEGSVECKGCGALQVWADLSAVR